MKKLWSFLIGILALAGLVAGIIGGPVMIIAGLSSPTSSLKPIAVAAEAVRVNQTAQKTSVNPTAQPTPEPVAVPQGDCPDPRVSRTVVVCADALSVLGSLPVSNNPAEFGNAQVGLLHKGDQISVLGRYTTALENGITANLLVISVSGRKAAVFHMKLDSTFTTNVDDNYYVGLPEIAFP